LYTLGNLLRVAEPTLVYNSRTFPNVPFPFWFSRSPSTRTRNVLPSRSYLQGLGGILMGRHWNSSSDRVPPGHQRKFRETVFN